ncbi:MAG: folylpolyglutamate synthase/dihydrofolate synthase family protein [Candidatus Firestonebacteria bacterium]
MKKAEAIEWLETFTDYEKTTSYSYNAAYFDLNRMKYLLACLGNPEKQVRYVHIAGTKGKGSTAHFLAEILRSSGLRTGLYTSPHIISMRERIKVNGVMISEKKLSALVPGLKKAVAATVRHSGFGRPTYFEAYTALAFMHFAREKCAVAALETGMGGRLDATNVIIPLVSVLTPISLDHVKELGNTVAKIAAEKAGIIKNTVPVVAGPQEKSALKTIENKAKEKGSRLLLYGRDFCVKKVLPLRAGGSTFNIITPSHHFKRLKISMTGKHQTENAALAVSAAIIALRRLGRADKIEKAVPLALPRVKLPGRLEYLPGKPGLLLDAAHNAASALILKKALQENYSFKKLVLVIGMSVNKDIKSVKRILYPLAGFIVAVKSSNYRSAAPSVLLKGAGMKALGFESVLEGLNYAESIAGKRDLICVTGSFYVLSDVFNAVSLRYRR